MTTFRYVRRRADWRDRAAEAAYRRKVHRWHRERQNQEGYRDADWIGLDDPDYSRLYEKLGGPFHIEADGRFGAFPYPKYADSSSAGWRDCSAVPIQAVRDLDFGVELDNDTCLMVWPWIARFACDYAHLQDDFDRDEDLSPSELDEELDKVERAALTISASTRRLLAARYVSRPWTKGEFRKTLALAQINHRLGEAVGDKTWDFANLQRMMTDLRNAAKALRSDIAAVSLALGKVGNPGVQGLTSACAYVWSDFTARKPSAARRTTSHSGEESDFVLFVQSIARLRSNVVPSISQIASALMADDWHSDPQNYRALRWNSSDGDEDGEPSASGK